LSFVVTRYRSDESLLIYRRSFEALVRALLPRMQAQALHPIPYPNMDSQAAFNEAAASAGLYSPQEIDGDFKKTAAKHRHSAAHTRKPEQADLEWAWSRQIFYSWWNGFVLGYPEHFINSYCESFHNGLDVEEKRQWSAIAQKHVKRYFARANLTRPAIAFGLAQPLSRRHMELVLSGSVL